MNKAALFALALIASPALGETLTCSERLGIKTCLGNEGYVSHESKWQGVTTGDDNWGNKWSETEWMGRKTLTIKPGDRQK